MTDHLEGIINAWKLDGVMVVILILAICLLLGMVLESMSIVVLMVPVVAPLPISLDINLVWFGILLVVATEISLITPPVGMNVFVLNILKAARPDWQFSTYRAYVGGIPRPRGRL